MMLNRVLVWVIGRGSDLFNSLCITNVLKAAMYELICIFMNNCVWFAILLDVRSSEVQVLLPVLVSRNNINTFFTFAFALLLTIPQSNDILSLGLTDLSTVDGVQIRQR
jgi:hypothetical protein